MPSQGPPPGAHVTYNQQFRRCWKPGCSSCAPDRPGHGPYWYAYWREDGRRHSYYLGKRAPLAAPVAQVAGPDTAPPCGYRPWAAWPSGVGTSALESLALYAALHAGSPLAGCLEILAGVCADLDDAERAVHFGGAAAAVREALGTPLPGADRSAFDREMASLRRTPGDDRFDRAWAAGLAMPIDQAAARAGVLCAALARGTGARGIAVAMSS